MNNDTVLVLDFDGVICDGLNECLLSSWNTWYELGVADFSEDTLSHIPQAFTKCFTLVRNFVRHSGHFVVPFVMEGMVFASAREFESAYEQITAETARRFLSGLEHYRRQIIKERKETWLRMHHFFDGMEGVLRNRLEKLYVVSGKDLPSIKCLLESKGIELPTDHIYASQRSKLAALHGIKKQEGIDAKQLVFCDDNFSNMQEAKREGFSALWADWGYQTSEDRERAKASGISAVSLREFVERFH